MKPLLLFILSSGSCFAAGAEFEGLKKCDLFAYFDRPNPGFSLFPVPDNDIDATRAAEAARLRMAKELHNGTITIANVLQLAEELMADRNYTGYLVCLMSAIRKGHEVAVLKWAKSKLGDEGRFNLVLVYGALCVAGSAETKSAEIHESAVELLTAIEIRNVKMPPTLRMSDPKKAFGDSVKALAPDGK